MIKLESVEMKTLLKSPNNWNQYVGDKHIDDETIEILNRLLVNCGKICIEYPYYDNEYLSIYYLYYIKKFSAFPKECYRIHLFNNKELYCGFVTLRPTVGQTKIGKSYIAPQLFLGKGNYVMSGEYCAHVLGAEFRIKAIPWMKQDTDIAVCGHVAAWISMQIGMLRASNYSSILMGDLIKSVPEIDNRMIPTAVINVRQMVKALSEFGFSPVNIQKRIYDYHNEASEEFQTFLNELFAYIESRIAAIVCIGTSEHAVAVVGHGRVDYAKLDTQFKDRKIIYFSELIETLIVHDDAQQPYLTVRYKKNENPFTDKEKKSMADLPSYYIDDFDRMIVPLRDRMQYSFKSLVIRVKDYIKSESILDDTKQYVERVYLVSVNDLKKYARENDSMDFRYRQILLETSMPVHVWCVDFSTFDEYKQQKMSIKLIADTTACNKALLPFLLIQTQHSVCVFENGKKQQYNIDIEPYTIFKGNLEGV